MLNSVDGLIAKDKKNDLPSIEAGIDKYCNGGGLGPKEKKMCYYMEPIKRSIAQPFSLKMPKDRVCKRLKKSNPEICEIKYAVKVPAAESGETKEETAAKIKKMRVKELKGILADRGVDCVGCMEKEDYVKRVMDTNDMAQEL